MFEPLRELLLEDPHALLEDAAVLGEKAGRLFGSRDRAAYAALGGAIYAPLRCANDNVVSWGVAHAAAAPGTASGKSDHSVGSSVPHGTGYGQEGDAAAPSQGGDTDAAGAASSTVYGDAATCQHLPWARAPDAARTTNAPTTTARLSSAMAPLLYDGERRRPRGGRRPPLARQLLHAAPHVLPRLAARVLQAAAFVLPALRAVFPRAVPRAVPRRLQLAPARRGGPEQVTAAAFHPHALWLAVAVDEGSADGTTRVVVHDVAANAAVCVLTHAFQVEVQWMAWKPHARDVLVVGTRGGVLVWRLTSDTDGSDAAGYSVPRGGTDGVAHALFYPTRSGFTVTSASFSHVDANTLACASTADTRLVLLRLSEPPFSPRACGTVVAPSVDGGLGQVLFDDADLFVLCTVCAHSSLALLHVERALVAGAGAGAAMPVGLHARVVPTPAPVHDVVRASGLGPSHYFLRTAGLEGVLLAHINPFIGVEVVAMISTGLYRGVGGAVVRIACSRRRLWVQTETNHLVVCRYGQREGQVTVIPIGVAATEAVELVTFEGCSTGSLLAMVEADSSVSFMPCYHS